MAILYCYAVVDSLLGNHAILIIRTPSSLKLVRSRQLIATDWVINIRISE